MIEAMYLILGQDFKGSSNTTAPGDRRWQRSGKGHRPYAAEEDYGEEDFYEEDGAESIYFGEDWQDYTMTALILPWMAPRTPTTTLSTTRMMRLKQMRRQPTLTWSNSTKHMQHTWTFARDSRT